MRSSSCRMILAERARASGVRMSDFDRPRRAALWQNVSAAILASPVARAAYEGAEPPELAPLLDKTRHQAYRIVDADVEGLDPDVVIEGALGAALAVALEARAAALESLR